MMIILTAYFTPNMVVKHHKVFKIAEHECQCIGKTVCTLLSLGYGNKHLYWTQNGQITSDKLFKAKSLIFSMLKV